MVCDALGWMHKSEIHICTVSGSKAHTEEGQAMACQALELFQKDLACQDISPDVFGPTGWLLESQAKLELFQG